MTHKIDFTSADPPLGDTEAQLEELARVDRANAPTDLEDHLFASTRLILHSKAHTTAPSNQPIIFTKTSRLVFARRMLAAAAIVLLVFSVGVALRVRRSSPASQPIATETPSSIDDELDDWLELLSDSTSTGAVSSLSDVSQALDELETDLSSPWSSDSFEFDTESL